MPLCGLKNEEYSHLEVKRIKMLMTVKLGGFKIVLDVSICLRQFSLKLKCLNIFGGVGWVF